MADGMFVDLLQLKKMLRQLIGLAACLLPLQSCHSEDRASDASQRTASANSKETRAPVASAAVEIRNGLVPGSLELVARGVIELDAELMVEQQLGNGSFESVKNLDLGSMRLISSCEQRFSTCIQLDERGLKPLPWSGMSCSSQCNRTCDKNQRLEGRFRFVIKSCDGKNRFEGPTFELPRK